MTAAARKSAVAVLLGLIAAGLAALWLRPLAVAWKIAPDLGNGWAAPLLMGYLWWERWRLRPAFRPDLQPGGRFWTGAAVIVVAGGALQLVLEPYPLWPAAVWAYCVLLAATAIAAAGLLAGRAGALWLGGPLVILAGALPWTSQVDRYLVFPLRRGMAVVAAEISNLLGHPALAEGTSVRLGTDWVGVDEACGGIRSLEAAVMVALFLGEWLRLSWRRRAALVLAGILSAVFGNFIRIVFLSLRASEGAAAARAAHDAAGWLALGVTLGLTGLVAFAWRRRGRAVSAAAPSARGEPNPRAVAWIALVVAGLALGRAGVEAWYARGDRESAEAPHWTVRLPTGDWSFRSAELGEESSELLRPDYYTAGTWQDGRGDTLSAYYIEWRQGQAARFVPFLHNPTVCLPLAGCDLVGSLGEIPVAWSGGTIPFHAYVFRQAGRSLVVAFAVWDTGRNRPLETLADAGTKRGWILSQWKDVAEARRSQPAQMLSLAISGDGAREMLVPVLQSLVTRH